MKTAVANLQRYIFVLLLYSSAVFATILDMTGNTNRTPFYVTFEALIFFLAITSLSAVPKGYGWILAFVLGGIIFNFTYSPVPLSASINGIREVVMVLAMPVFYYKIFAPGNEEEAMRYVRIFRKFAWVFLLIQFFPVMIQYKQFGPGDYVGGTYGWMCSGSLTLIILCLVLFLFQFHNPMWKKGLLLLLLFPLMMNETKISFILIPMMVVFIFLEPKMKSILLAAVGGALFLIIFNQLYSNQDTSLSSMSDIFNTDFLNEYLLADYDTHPDVPRFTKIIFGYKIISENINTLFFGMEYGMFRGTYTGEISTFARNYNWLLSGTRPYLFFIMMQGGLMLVTGIFLVILKICNFFKNANKQTIFYFIIFLVILTYADSFRWHNFLIVYMFLLFFVNSDLFKSKAYLYEDIDSVS